MPVRPLPPNNVTEQMREAHAYDAHRQRVDSARATVDTRPPRTYMHNHLNMKKLQIDEVKHANIERQNRNLLQRMSQIMKTRGYIDNQNDDFQKGSLNENRRRRETLEIARENQRIHARLAASKPDYDHNEWDRDWAANQRVIERRSATSQKLRSKEHATGKKSQNSSDDVKKEKNRRKKGDEESRVSSMDDDGDRNKVIDAEPSAASKPEEQNE